MPAWEYGIVGFLDILGFGSFVRTDSQAAEPHHLERLLSALEQVRSSAAAGVDLRAFSDSVILSAALSIQSVVDVVIAVVHLQRAFVSRGVLIRGAIAFGKHFADEHAIYSAALVTAYELERDHARFPRVIVDDNLLDWFINDSRLAEQQRSTVVDSLRRDRDNRVFVHYLDGPLLPAHETLLRGYDHSGLTASVLEKIQWLAEYHNYAACSDGGTPVQWPFAPGFRLFS